MLIPGFLSTEAPHALRTTGVIPVVMIFSAIGFWWLMSLILHWHHLTNPHAVTDKKIYEDAQAPLEKIFDQTGSASRLNLVTCDGVWDKNTHNYNKRLVVYSERVD